MALELKDVLAELGVTEDADKLTIEQFREHRDKTYVGRAVAHQDEDIVKKVSGKFLGSIETAVTRAFKGLGIELSGEETKGKKLEDIITMAAERAGKTIEEVKAEAGKGNDEKLQKALEDLEKATARKKETETALKEAQGIISQKEQEFTGKIKEFKLGSKLGEAKAKIPLSDNADEYRLAGFEVKFKEKYNVDLDDSDNIVITDKEGKQIKNATGGGFYGFEDIYKKELEEAKMLKVNGSAAITQKAVIPQGNMGNNGGGNNQQNNNFTTGPQPNEKATQQAAAYGNQ